MFSIQSILSLAPAVLFPLAAFVVLFVLGTSTQRQSKALRHVAILGQELNGAIRHAQTLGPELNEAVRRHNKLAAELEQAEADMTSVIKSHENEVSSLKTSSAKTTAILQKGFEESLSNNNANWHKQLDKLSDAHATKIAELDTSLAEAKRERERLAVDIKSLLKQNNQASQENRNETEPPADDMESLLGQIALALQQARDEKEEAQKEVEGLKDLMERTEEVLTFTKQKAGRDAQLLRDQADADEQSLSEVIENLHNEARWLQGNIEDLRNELAYVREQEEKLIGENFELQRIHEQDEQQKEELMREAKAALIGLRAAQPGEPLPQEKGSFHKPAYDAAEKVLDEAENHNAVAQRAQQKLKELRQRLGQPAEQPVGQPEEPPVVPPHRELPDQVATPILGNSHQAPEGNAHPLPATPAEDAGFTRGPRVLKDAKDLLHLCDHRYMFGRGFNKAAEHYKAKGYGPEVLVLGEGGMGLVVPWRKPTDLDETWPDVGAVKLMVADRGYFTKGELLGPRNQLRATRVERFMSRHVKPFDKEYKVLDRAKHANVLRVFGLLKHSNGIGRAMVMERLDGIAWDLWCYNGDFSAQLGLSYMKQMADALAYIHQRGVFHYDFKPDNCGYIDQGDRGITFKLIDFGLALDTGDRNNTSGTPFYRAPEVLCAGGVNTMASGQADIWALIGSVVHLCGGCPKFDTLRKQGSSMELQHIDAMLRLETLDGGDKFLDWVDMKKFLAEGRATAEMISLRCDWIYTYLPKDFHGLWPEDRALRNEYLAHSMHGGKFLQETVANLRRLHRPLFVQIRELAVEMEREAERETGFWEEYEDEILEPLEPLDQEQDDEMF